MKILYATAMIGVVLAFGTMAARADAGSPNPTDSGTASAPDSAFSLEPAPTGAPTAPSSPPENGLERINTLIKLEPSNTTAYIIRGNIYSERKMWTEAQSDYQKALSLNPHNSAAKVNLAELQFRQKQYDQARATFLTIEGDPNLGDLAAYMVFLSDLYAAHEAAASQELAVFNTAGENASYYFGNIAWDIFHQNASGARDYLQSAQTIYAPTKIRLYESNLLESGYLPLKD